MQYYLILSVVTILILIDGFLQWNIILDKKHKIKVTILILIDGFLQFSKKYSLSTPTDNVTILILIDGFLQF